MKISVHKDEKVKKMKEKIWKLLERFIPLFLTMAIAFVGWHTVDNLAAKRDRANKQRDLRIEYLISAYSKLANASWRDPKPKSQYFADMETAMADIQLFGTDSQIENAKTMMNEFQKTGSSSLNELLRDLRNDLRREMDLPEIEGKVQWFRPEGAPTHLPTTEKR